MKQCFLFLGILILSGCSAVLPSKEVDLSYFIPKEDPVFEISDYFPEKCDWRHLVKVVDGDTIEVSQFWIFGNQRVRFIGIDTPETVHPNKPVQPFGPEASAKTKEFLADTENVCLIYDPKADALDKYGRLLAYIFSEQGVDINAELLKLGLARGYFYFPFSRKEEFHRYEEFSKKLQIGVWSLLHGS